MSDLIIKRCIKKDRDAQRILYDTYAPVLLGLCRRYTLDQPEAEDILQEGFVKIFLNLKNYRGQGTLLNWMKKVMINTAITYYHKHYKHRYHYEIEESESSGSMAAGLAEADFTREELLKVIEDLPAGYKMVFNLYAVEGYKHKEISELLNIDINTSKSQYSRAKKLIREKLESISKTKLKTQH